MEDSVSTPVSKEMEVKIDDAPKNAKELHAHEEYEVIIKSRKLQIKQQVDVVCTYTWVYSSFRRMRDEIRGLKNYKL
jgi:hypothetical protein